MYFKFCELVDKFKLSWNHFVDNFIGSLIIKTFSWFEANTEASVYRIKLVHLTYLYWLW